ncbi:MAG: ArsC family transcriptional regulator [Candidatus Aminicenantes bacterium RBG_13_63_10]|nr:MAG: ArsC family transcriptional regulator [Candidatus Aminicenantes bacterium RBG_13_63_10]
MKKKVLFVCTHNSARSQMAEAFLSSTYGDRYEASSAGTEPTGINPRVVEAMKEIGFDLSRNLSTSVDEFLGKKLDLIVTLCDDARETCPFFPGGLKRDHQGFKDPGSCSGTEDEIRACVRRIRDEIADWVRRYFR